MKSPSYAVDLGRPYNSLFEFQVVHRYVFTVVSKKVLFRPVFLKLFCSIAPFSLSKHRCRPPSMIKQTQGIIFKEFCLEIDTYHDPQFGVIEVLGDLHKASKYWETF